MRGDGDAAEKRRNIDDLTAAAALDEVPHGDLRPVEGRLHVHRDHRIDIVIGEVEDLSGDATAGVIDPHVEVAEHLERGAAEPLHVGAPSDVGLDSDCARPAASHRILGDALEDVAAARGKRQRMTLEAESLSESGADAAARAGEYDRFGHSR